MTEVRVGLAGVGWVATQHLQAFQKHPRARVVALCSRDEGRARKRLAQAGLSFPDVRFTRRYDDLLRAPDIDAISIATPNHLHAPQAVRAARAGKHILLEKPTGLDAAELAAISRAVRAAGVTTIVSFELHYNPYLRVARWLRESGRLGTLTFARFQYLSHVTDWYSGWSWVRTKKSGRSHLLAAGCHAVDAMRWCTGLEPSDVTAFHTKVTPGYEWPTTIVANFRLAARRPVLAQLVSSTDFQMPYAFGVEMMGDKATLQQDLLLWNKTRIDPADLAAHCPVPGARFVPATTPTGADAIRVIVEMPGSADVGGHPFQGEIDEFVDAILAGRDTHLNVFDAEKTMRACLAADRSAALNGRRIAVTRTTRVGPE